MRIASLLYSLYMMRGNSGEQRVPVINGDFSTDSGWDKGAGWTISGGKAHSNSDSGFNIFSQNNLLTIGLTYRLEFDMEYSSGELRMQSGDLSDSGLWFSSSGHKNVTFTAIRTDLRFTAFHGFVGSIDNVRLYLIHTISPSLKEKFSLLWFGLVSGDSLVDVISGRNIAISNNDLTGDFIPADSEATFALPEDADLQNDDEDDLWFTSEGTAKQVTVSDLIGTDFTRTFVKYDNVIPHNVRWIGLLKAGEVLTQSEKDELSKKFELWMYYFGELNGNGFVKENRTIPDPNLISNGTFDDATGWTLGAGWTISDGKANANVPSGFTSITSNQGSVLEIGETYLLELDVERTSGAVRCQSGDIIANPALQWTSSGAKSVTFVATQTFLRFTAFGPGGTFVGSIDNIKVYKQK